MARSRWATPRAPNLDHDYPTVYLFHGINGGSREWEPRDFQARLDELQTTGGLAESIVVMPDAESQWYIDSTWRTMMRMGALSLPPLVGTPAEIAANTPETPIVVPADHNAAAAARAMYLHPNTLAYRLRAIRRLLAGDPSRGDLRLQLELALKLEDLSNLTCATPLLD